MSELSDEISSNTMDQSVGFFSQRERESRREDIESRLASVLYERVTDSQLLSLWKVILFPILHN